MADEKRKGRPQKYLFWSDWESWKLKEWCPFKLNDLPHLKQDIGDLKGHLVEIKTNCVEEKTEIKEIKSEIKVMTGRTSKIDNNWTRINTDMLWVKWLLGGMVLAVVGMALGIIFKGGI
jgi:hypothetical protein